MKLKSRKQSMALGDRLPTTLVVVVVGGAGTGREYEEASGRLGMLCCLMWVLSVSP